ncbi:unnamed protein product, partial [Medioppia subpectinata]
CLFVRTDGRRRRQLVSSVAETILWRDVQKRDINFARLRTYWRIIRLKDRGVEHNMRTDRVDRRTDVLVYKAEVNRTTTLGGIIFPLIRQNQEMEKSLRIAQELSNLIIYCRAVQFVPNKAGHFTEMSSFPESKVEKFLSPNNSQVKLIKHNETQFTRVYPKGGRIDSSNYDPMKMWLNGIQMAALNYQTPDRAMQLNGAKFRQNGRSGYVLRSDLMFDEHFNPCDRTSLKGVETLSLTIKVLGARHLMKSGRGIICPLVEVEIVGTDYDAHKQKTTTI